MAFITPYELDDSPGYAYNVDWSVGGGVCGNRSADVALVQALLRIVHFELDNPAPPPAGETGIAVDGLCGPRTVRFIMNAQSLTKSRGIPTRIDGILDPFRAVAGQLSSRARVHYALESLNAACYKRCRAEDKPYYRDLPGRSDLPPVLRTQLASPWRKNACQYGQGAMR